MKIFLTLLLWQLTNLCMARDMDHLAKVADLVFKSGNIEELQIIKPKNTRILFYSSEEKIILLQEDNRAVFCLLMAEDMKSYHSFGEIKMTDPLSLMIINKHRIWTSAEMEIMPDKKIQFTLIQEKGKSPDYLTIDRNNKEINSFWSIGSPASDSD